MAKKKAFDMNRYEEIKKILKDNKIDSKDLDKYIQTKALKYKRYREEIFNSDDDIIKIVNGEEVTLITEKPNDTNE